VSRRWPLHPRPYDWESLDRYVRRLAEAYGVRFETFCLRALGIERQEAQTLNRAPREVLERLAAGTGVPLAQLEAMVIDRLWSRLSEEVSRVLATPDGQALMERFSPRKSDLSRNS
jgi:hypothetical protein